MCSFTVILLIVKCQQYIFITDDACFQNSDRNNISFGKL